MKSKMGLFVALAIFFSGNTFAETLQCQVTTEDKDGVKKTLLNRQILLGFDHSGKINEPIQVGTREPMLFTAVVNPSQQVRDRGTLSVMRIGSLESSSVGKSLRGALFIVSPKNSHVERQTLFHPMVVGANRFSIQATCSIQ